MQAPSTNTQLIRAIDALHDAPEGAMQTEFRAVLDALLASALIVPDDDGEPLAFEGEDDELLLPLFTDLLELHMFEPGAPWTELRGEDAVRRVADGDYDGLVINPRGKRFDLAREDVLDLFDISG